MVHPTDDVGATGGAGSMNEDIPFVRPADQIRRERRRFNNANRQRDAQVRPSSYSGAVTRGHQVPRSSVMGNAINTGLRAGPLPSRDFFVSRVHKDDGIDKIRTFLHSRKVNLRDIRLTSHPNAVCNSFKITVTLTDAEVISKPDFWETGIRIRKWQERNDEPASVMS
jgi:hypothetical protein